MVCVLGRCQAIVQAILQPVGELKQLSRPVRAERDKGRQPRIIEISLIVVKYG